MAKVLIDIPEDMYTQVSTSDAYVLDDTDWILLENAIANGIALDGLTNGEVIQKMFPNNRVDIVMGKVYFFTHEDEDEDFDEFVVFSLEWWNRKWGE